MKIEMTLIGICSKFYPSNVNCVCVPNPNMSNMVEISYINISTIMQQIDYKNPLECRHLTEFLFFLIFAISTSFQ